MKKQGQLFHMLQPIPLHMVVNDMEEAINFG